MADVSYRPYVARVIVGAYAARMMVEASVVRMLVGEPLTAVEN